MLAYGVRRGRLTDRHVGDRTQRARPLSIGLASVAAGLLLLMGDHTWPQVLAGVALGGPLAAGAFLALT
ncbi:hypothetical protein [Micromonospora sp. CNB394]|uniref:hypothetical protein n=1 Tax=Micromonospora sp. CNB394 TaxID=1169151 RepID=UPI00037EA5AE|nr:hypothetical protein [Micromonospora sp. CNB394]